MRRKPLVIAVHGDGIDVDMKIDDVSGLDQVFEVLARQAFNGAAYAASFPHVPHVVEGVAAAPPRDATAAIMARYSDDDLAMILELAVAENKAREARRS